MNHRATILLVDDNEQFLSAASSFLTKHGYPCDCSPDGVHAAGKLRERPYDALVADIGMLGNERLELVEEAGRLEEYLPVILVTGFPTVETAVQAVGLPVVAYMVKPFSLKDLLRNVELAVGRKGLVNRVSACRRRFAELEGSLLGIERMAAGMPIDETRLPREMFVDIATRNLLDCIGDITHLIRSAEYGESPHVCQLYHCPRLNLMKACLEDAVDVLERTRNAFKSKELASLRKKIEAVLATS